MSACPYKEVTATCQHAHIRRSQQHVNMPIIYKEVITHSLEQVSSGQVIFKL